MSIKGVLSVLIFWIAVVLVSINITKGMFAIFTLVGLLFSVVFISVETYNMFK